MICALILFFVLGVNSWAYLSDLKILSKQEIVKLTDEGLIDAFIEVVVEVKASEEFHSTSGFTPKEYENYKDLIRYKILLIQEIDKRKLPTPRVNITG